MLQVAFRQHIGGGAPQLPVPPGFRAVHRHCGGGGRPRWSQPSVRLGARPRGDGGLSRLLRPVVFLSLFVAGLHDGEEADACPGGRGVRQRESGGEDAEVLRDLPGVQEAVGLLRGESFVGDLRSCNPFMMSDRTIVSVYSYLRRLHLANFLQLIDDD